MLYESIYSLPDVMCVSSNSQIDWLVVYYHYIMKNVESDDRSYVDTKSLCSKEHHNYCEYTRMRLKDELENGLPKSIERIDIDDDY